MTVGIGDNAGNAISIGEPATSKAMSMVSLDCQLPRETG